MNITINHGNGKTTQITAKTESEALEKIKVALPNASANLEINKNSIPPLRPRNITTPKEV